MSAKRTLYWVACQRCDAVLTSTDLAEVCRLFAEHEMGKHDQSLPHYPQAGSTPIEGQSA